MDKETREELDDIDKCFKYISYMFVAMGSTIIAILLYILLHMWGYG